MGRGRRDRHFRRRSESADLAVRWQRLQGVRPRAIASAAVTAERAAGRYRQFEAWYLAPVRVM